MGSRPQLSGKQQAALDEFRELITDVLHPEHDDIDLLKWLHAKGFNPKKAKEMYTKSMKWRTEINADQLKDEYEEPEVMRQYYGGGLCGFDMEGCPIRVDPAGKIDVKGLIRSCKKDDITETIVVRIEKTKSIMRDVGDQRGRRVDQIVQILDMSGFDSGRLDMTVVHFYLDVLKIIDENYPGLVKRSYIINAPSVFMMAWRFMKRFLSKAITEKFQIFHDDGKEAMLADLPADQVPVHYGGTLTDDNGDPMCKTKINYGGPVPTSYYRTMENSFPTTGIVTTHVNRADTLLLPVLIDRPHTKIKWVFSTEGNPIKFGVYRESIPGKQDLTTMDEIRPIREFQSHQVPEDGVLMCDRVGSYILVFDNRGSRLTRRKLMYFIDTEVPDDNLAASDIL